MLIRASWDFILFGSRPVLLPRHSCLEMQVKHKPVFESDQQKHKPVLTLSSFYYSKFVASGNVAMNGRHNKELWNLEKKERLFEFWFTSVLFITFAEQSRCRLLTPFISVCSDSFQLCVLKVNCLDTLAWMGRQNTTSITIIIIFSITIIIITIRCLCMNGYGRQNDATFHDAWVCVSASTEWSRP